MLLTFFYSFSSLPSNQPLFSFSFIHVEGLGQHAFSISFCASVVLSLPFIPPPSDVRRTRAKPSDREGFTNTIRPNPGIFFQLCLSRSSPDNIFCSQAFGTSLYTNPRPRSRLSQASRGQTRLSSCISSFPCSSTGGWLSTWRNPWKISKVTFLNLGRWKLF